MGWELFDRRERYIGHFTSNSGYTWILQEVKKRKPRLPLFYQWLVDQGGDVSPELIKEIEAFIESPGAEIAEDLLKVIRKRKYAHIDI